MLIVSISLRSAESDGTVLYLFLSHVFCSDFFPNMRFVEQTMREKWGTRIYEHKYVRWMNYNLAHRQPAIKTAKKKHPILFGVFFFAHCLLFLLFSSFVFPPSMPLVASAPTSFPHSNQIDSMENPLRRQFWKREAKEKKKTRHITIHWLTAMLSVAGELLKRNRKKSRKISNL